MLKHLKKLLEKLPEGSSLPKSFYFFPPDLEGEIIMRVKENASKETINALKNSMIEQDLKMDPKQFIVKIDKMNREHFNNYIWPRITKT